jgi:GNAT superfamily N-acetyltransferase
MDPIASSSAGVVPQTAVTARPTTMPAEPAPGREVRSTPSGVVTAGPAQRERLAGLVGGASGGSETTAAAETASAAASDRPPRLTELNTHIVQGSQDPVFQTHLQSMGQALSELFGATDSRFKTWQGAAQVLVDRVDSGSRWDALMLITSGKKDEVGENPWVGMMSLCEWDDPDFDKVDGPGWLTDVVIREDLRGRGAGGLVLPDMIALMRERGWTHASLYTDNPKAQALYEKNGFVVDRKEDVLDTDTGETNVETIMRLDLSEPPPARRIVM